MKEEQNTECEETLGSTTAFASDDYKPMNLDFNKKKGSFRDKHIIIQYAIEMFVTVIVGLPAFMLVLLPFPVEVVERVSTAMFSEALIYSILGTLVILWGVCVWLLSETHKNIRDLEIKGNSIGFFDGSYGQIWLSLLSIPADAAIVMFCALVYRGSDDCRAICFVLICAALAHASQVLWDSIKAKRSTSMARKKIEEMMRKSVDSFDEA